MKLLWLRLLLSRWSALAALVVSTSGAYAQSADALLDKLVEKGVLTTKEAHDLRDEADKNYSQAHAMRNLMPDYVKSIKISGDLRLRYEGFFSDSTFKNPGTTNKYQWQDRNRFRYRLRLGVTANMTDDLEVGAVLASGQLTTAGGNALSANQTFTGNGANNYIWIQQAYGKWSPLSGPDWTATLIAGKMENPLQLDDMVFDPNYMPTGAGLQLGSRLSDQHSLKATGAAFFLNDNPDFGQAPYMLAGQLRWNATWSPKISSTLGASYLFLGNLTNLDNVSVPNLNGGNTRNIYGALTNQYTPVVLDAAFTYTAASFPLYKGPFPIRIGGAAMYNLSAPNSEPNSQGYYSNTNFFAWNAGIVFGKAGKKGTWEVSYTYKWVGADAWYEEFQDNDFGALYWQTPDSMVSSPNGFLPATPIAPPLPYPANQNLSYYVPGSNAKGHIVRFAWSPADAFTLSLKWLLTTPVTPYPHPKNSVNGMSSFPVMSRVQVDATWKF